MRRGRGRWLVITLGLTAALVGPVEASADLIIDQQNTAYDGFIGPGSGQGQSFTPTLSGIDFATFVLGVPSKVSRPVFVDLWSGDGFGGTFLGLSNEVLVDGSKGFQTYQFDFPTTIPLIPGNVYTLGLNEGFDDLFALEGSGNPYPGGVEYDSSLIAQPGFDLVFSEGVAVPEPSSLFTAVVGVLTFCGVRAWRRRGGGSGGDAIGNSPSTPRPSTPDR